jgi:hypothetical protein
MKRRRQHLTIVSTNSANRTDAQALRPRIAGSRSVASGEHNPDPIDHPDSIRILTGLICF